SRLSSLSENGSRVATNQAYLQPLKRPLLKQNQGVPNVVRIRFGMSCGDFLNAFGQPSRPSLGANILAVSVALFHGANQFSRSRADCHRLFQVAWWPAGLPFSSCTRPRN